MAIIREAFAEWLERFGRPRPAVLDRLRHAKGAQDEIRSEDVRGIAREVGWPVAGVSGAASFYADFAGGPRGRRHVRVCEGTSCFAATAGRHVERLEAALGVERGGCAADGSVSLQGVYCLGFCYASPAALDGRRPRTGPDLGGLLREPRIVPDRVTGRRIRHP